MINYVNSYMSQAKSQLQAQGVGLHMDPAGRPVYVKFSANLIIFEKFSRLITQVARLTRFFEKLGKN